VSASNIGRESQSTILGANEMHLKTNTMTWFYNLLGGLTPARLILLLLIIGAWVGAHAQFDTGAVLGNIKDPSGATVSSAKVELLSISKGVRVLHQTDASGAYEFDSLQPGEYTISVSAPGFQVSKTDIFKVNVGARQRVDLTLNLGMGSETVTVSGAPTQLET
jgi:hypothetical protein